MKSQIAHKNENSKAFRATTRERVRDVINGLQSMTKSSSSNVSFNVILCEITSIISSITQLRLFRAEVCYWCRKKTMIGRPERHDEVTSQDQNAWFYFLCAVVDSGHLWSEQSTRVLDLSLSTCGKDGSTRERKSYNYMKFISCLLDELSFFFIWSFVIFCDVVVGCQLFLWFSTWLMQQEISVVIEWWNFWEIQICSEMIQELC